MRVDSTKRAKLLFSVLVLVIMLMLVSCGTDAVPTETNDSQNFAWKAAHSPIPCTRTGLDRQGISALQNGFECTDSGVYFMCNTGAWSYLLYGDHDSDALVKLCGRPDCTHTGADCNAYFRRGTNVCFYNGYLYAVEHAVEGINLVRMNLDGTDRVTVINTHDFQDHYTASFSPHIWNGIFTVGLKSVNEEGQTVTQMYYYKLDGSMRELAPTDFFIAYSNDGDRFISLNGSSTSSYGVCFNLWDPESNSHVFLTDMLGKGYYGAEEAYYIRDGAVFHLTYASGKEEKLFDTGLAGTHNLRCFPDCIVVGQSLPDGQLLASEDSADQVLHFYNWDYEYLGHLQIGFPWEGTPDGLICGETENRIIFTDNIYKIPRYYIEKADFGTGSIQLHEYQMPDVDWEELNE